jgi:CheY-like chemotaxis protein
MTKISPQKRLRIIYAEDSPTDQELLSRVLMNRGHDVVCCDNGSLALQAIQAEAFDILISDNDMPRMNGLALVQELRRIEHPPKIIVISGFLEPEVEERYRAFGVELFLLKPSPDEVILQTVEND